MEKSLADKLLASAQSMCGLPPVAIHPIYMDDPSEPIARLHGQGGEPKAYVIESPTEYTYDKVVGSAGVGLVVGGGNCTGVQPAGDCEIELVVGQCSDGKVLSFLTPIQGQKVEFWPRRMPRRWAGIQGYFEGGRFWSQDGADYWLPSEVVTWHSLKK